MMLQYLMLTKKQLKKMLNILKFISNKNTFIIQLKYFTQVNSECTLN
jgi:hypothetical protein